MAETVKKGSVGIWVKVLQYIVGAAADGEFGINTQRAVIAYQKSKGLTADGIAGPKTWAAVQLNAPTLKPGVSGAYVFALETLLETMQHDGIYGKDEVNHVKAFQASANLTQDGIVGKNTWNALLNGVATGGKYVKEPTYFMQGDSRWKNVVFTMNNTYNKKQTIGNSGCGPTSAAMVVNTWWNSKITPVETAKMAVDGGFRTKNSGTAWSYFEWLAKKYKASKFIQTSSFETMKNCLAAGGYVVVSFGPSKWTNGGHYCVLWKYDDTYVYVKDPASSSSARAKGTYAEVRQAAKQYFCFYPDA